MSMLSEPRRKQKWSLNPRGNLWSKGNSHLIRKNLIFIKQHVKESFHNVIKNLGVNNLAKYSSLVKNYQGLIIAFEIFNVSFLIELRFPYSFNLIIPRTINLKQSVKFCFQMTQSLERSFWKRWVGKMGKDLEPPIKE